MWSIKFTYFSSWYGKLFHKFEFIGHDITKEHTITRDLTTRSYYILSFIRHQNKIKNSGYHHDMMLNYLCFRSSEFFLTKNPPSSILFKETAWNLTSMTIYCLICVRWSSVRLPGWDGQVEDRSLVESPCWHLMLLFQNGFLKKRKKK